ncbi:hypothetical protein BLNAU_6477 [Blattamonas nauphoetae]|uniref:Abnormal spindle-like microcephaly-associated protein ASH domain-containing protein n=1 Tax=Blattamonas nauphoetae TaxID=2049346 RepID=A0ABQ9Y3X1_9EUKA|nr:hypothetical protein BLNAU_6477 [Blattamonas nauphoetae]
MSNSAATYSTYGTIGTFCLHGQIALEDSPLYVTKDKELPSSSLPQVSLQFTGHLILDSFDGTKHSRDYDEDSLSNLPNITPSTNRRKSNHQNDSSLQSLPSAKQTQTDPITPQNQRTQDSLATPQTRRTVRSMETPARPPADAVRSTETQTIEMKTIETQTIPTPRPTQTDIQPVLESSRQIDERNQVPRLRHLFRRRLQLLRLGGHQPHRKHVLTSHRITRHLLPHNHSHRSRAALWRRRTTNLRQADLRTWSRLLQRHDFLRQIIREGNRLHIAFRCRTSPLQVQIDKFNHTGCPLRPHSRTHELHLEPLHQSDQHSKITNLTKSKLAFHLQVDETTCVSLNRPALPADSPYKNSSAPRTLSDAFTCNSTSGLLDSQGQENLLFTFFPSQVLAGFRLTQKMTLTVQVYGGPSVYEQQYPLTLVGTCESVEDEDVPSPSVRLETQPSFNRPPTFSPSRPIDRVDLLASQKSISPSKHVLVSTAVPDTPAALPFHSPASSSVYQSPQPSPARAMVQEKRWVYCEETFLSFPPTRVGQASSLSLTIVNTFPHSVTLFASPLSTGIPNSKVFTVPYRVIPVRPNSFIRINIEFRPDQRVSHDGTLSFRTEDGNTSLSVDVRGTGY